MGFLIVLPKAPLHIAFENEKIDAIKLLLQYPNINIDTQDIIFINFLWLFFQLTWNFI